MVSENKVDIVRMSKKLQYVREHTPERRTIELSVEDAEEIINRVIYAETELEMI